MWKLNAICGLKLDRLVWKAFPRPLMKLEGSFHIKGMLEFFVLPLIFSAFWNHFRIKISGVGQNLTSYGKIHLNILANTRERKNNEMLKKKKKPWTKRRKQTMNPYYKLKSKVMTTDASNFRSYLATKMLLPYWPHDIAYSWSRKWQPIPACLPGKSHGQRSLAGYSPWGLKASDMISVTEHTHKHTQGRWQEGLIYLTIQ